MDLLCVAHSHFWPGPCVNYEFMCISIVTMVVVAVVDYGAAAVVA